MFSTTAVYPNRQRDKADVERELKLPEEGESEVDIMSKQKEGKTSFAGVHGHNRVVYGDHGPYVEMSHQQIDWNNSPRIITKPLHAYYDVALSKDKDVMLY